MLPGLPDEFPLDAEVTVRLYLLGVVPLWRHTVRVVGAADGDGRTEEHGGPIRSWRHHLVVTPLSAGSCRYTDELEIDAGRLTAVVGAFARGFYRYRHRRWAALARVLA